MIVAAPDLVVSRTVRASCDQLWELFADPTQMSRWSPEAVRQQWIAPHTSAVPGARFRGYNRNGIHRWSTVSTVVGVDPGRSITWDVTFQWLAVARWSLAVAPAADASVLTQSFWDRRGRIMHALGLVGRGVRDVPSHNRAGMETTLAAIAAAARADDRDAS